MRIRALAVATAVACAVTPVPALAADGSTYYSTKQPYSPAAPISSYSQPPAGFHQIYTTSVDRHGSRGLSGFKYDDLAQQMLQAAQERGQLTGLGERLIPQVEAMIKVNEALTGPGEPGYGNLTTFGREELRGIGCGIGAAQHQHRQSFAPLQVIAHEGAEAEVARGVRRNVRIRGSRDQFDE